MSSTENKDQETSNNYLITGATALLGGTTTLAMVAAGCYIKPDFCISLMSKVTKTSTELVIEPKNTDLVVAWEALKGTMTTFAQQQLIPTQEQMITSALNAAVDSINDAVNDPAWNLKVDELDDKGHNHGADQSLMEDGDEEPGGEESGNESEGSHGITPKKGIPGTTNGNEDGSPSSLARTHEQRDFKESPEAANHAPKILDQPQRDVSTGSEYSSKVRPLSEDDLNELEHGVDDITATVRGRTGSVVHQEGDLSDFNSQKIAGQTTPVDNGSDIE